MLGEEVRKTIMRRHFFFSVEHRVFVPASAEPATVDHLASRQWYDATHVSPSPVESITPVVFTRPERAECCDLIVIAHSGGVPNTLRRRHCTRVLE